MTCTLVGRRRVAVYDGGIYRRTGVTPPVVLDPTRLVSDLCRVGVDGRLG